jgi:MSHA pilin protein MshD
MAVKRITGFTLIESVMTIVIMAVALVALSSFLLPQIQGSAREHYQVRAISLGQSILNQVLSGQFEAPFIPQEIETVRVVDDYVGCWVSNQASKVHCSTPLAGSLDAIFSDPISQHYPNFAANIFVMSDNAADVPKGLKKIVVQITAGGYGDYSFIAYKGDY